MCQQTITTFLSCPHTETDLFPCETSLDSDSGPCPSPTTKKEQSLTPKCPDCTFLDEALTKITADPSLAAVPRTVLTPIDPNHKYFVIRETWHCGHVTNTWSDIEREPGDTEYMDVDGHGGGSCRFCAEANPKTIQRMKDEGRWTEDPWGTKDTIVTNVGGSGLGGSSAPMPPPPTHVADFDNDEDDDDLYSAPAPPNRGRGPRVGPVDGESSEDESGAQGKGKGVKGRAPAYTEPTGDVGDSGCDSENDDARSLAGSDEEDRAPRRGRTMPFPRFDNNGDDDAAAAPPNWASGSPALPRGSPPPFERHCLSPVRDVGADEGDGDDDKPAQLSEEERVRLRVPVGITNGMLKSFLRRREGEAREGMRKLREGNGD